MRCCVDVSRQLSVGCHEVAELVGHYERVTQRALAVDGGERALNVEDVAAGDLGDDGREPEPYAARAVRGLSIEGSVQIV